MGQIGLAKNPNGVAKYDRGQKRDSQTWLKLGLKLDKNETPIISEYRFYLYGASA